MKAIRSGGVKKEHSHDVLALILGEGAVALGPFVKKSARFIIYEYLAEIRRFVRVRTFYA